LAWCKASSLTAAVARSLKGLGFPATKERIIEATGGQVVEGWDLAFFLDRSLERRSYHSLRSVMTDLEDWLERQG